MEISEIKNSQAWKTLVNLLKKGLETPEFSPILWVGAGTSAAAGYPATNSLVTQLRDSAINDDLPEFTPYQSNLPKDDPRVSFTHWIQVFAEKNGYGELPQTLAQIFSRRRPLPLHRSLVSLPWQAIYSTNYDELLEDALKENDQDFSPVTLEDNLELIGTALPLYKIHGSVTNFQRSILDEKSYQKYTDQYPFLKADLETELLRRPLVFVGCSMTDPRIWEWLEQLKEKNALQKRKYSLVLIREREWQKIPENYRNLMEEGNIHPLFFTRFNDLPILLEVLNQAEKKSNKKIPEKRAVSLIYEKRAF